jgi:hypothetical protein
MIIGFDPDRQGGSNFGRYFDRLSLFSLGTGRFRISAMVVIRRIAQSSSHRGVDSVQKSMLIRRSASEIVRTTSCRSYV